MNLTTPAGNPVCQITKWVITTFRCGFRNIFSVGSTCSRGAGKLRPSSSSQAARLICDSFGGALTPRAKPITLRPNFHVSNKRALRTTSTASCARQLPINSTFWGVGVAKPVEYLNQIANIFYLLPVFTPKHIRDLSGSERLEQKILN